MTFIWSRAASFTYCGLRNGYGYRLSLIHISVVTKDVPANMIVAGVPATVIRKIKKDTMRCVAR